MGFCSIHQCFLKYFMSWISVFCLFSISSLRRRKWFTTACVFALLRGTWQEHSAILLRGRKEICRYLKNASEKSVMPSRVYVQSLNHFDTYLGSYNRDSFLAAKIISCPTKLRETFSLWCLPSMNASSRRWPVFVRNLPPSHMTSTWLIVRLTGVTQPRPWVRMMLWSPKSAARLKPWEEDWFSGQRGYKSQYCSLVLNYSACLYIQCGKKVVFLLSTFRIDMAWHARYLLQAKMMDYNVQFLLMELESVGNIRLEEGCSTDHWYIHGVVKCNYRYIPV